MRSPRLLALGFATLLAAGAAAASADVKPGTATGTLTVNGKKVTLKHSYARRVTGATLPDSGQFELRPPEEGEKAAEATFVVLTDVPLPVADLTYVSALQTALAGGKVQGISWVVDKDGQAFHQSIVHKALGRDVPGHPDTFEVSGKDGHIAGKAASDADFFDDAWSYDVTFDATVAPLPTASMQPGSASGTLSVDGTVYQLRHAYARTEPGAFDPKQKQVVLELFDAEVAAGARKDHFAMIDLVRGGKVHGLSVTIDTDRRVITGGFYVTALESASSTGWQQLEAIAFDMKSGIEGRLYSKGVQDLLGHPVQIDVRFNVAPAAGK
jgi:hypothetical protein